MRNFFTTFGAVVFGGLVGYGFGTGVAHLLMAVFG